jgi:hypothetical protein
MNEMCKWAGFLLLVEYKILTHILDDANIIFILASTNT